MTRVLSGTVLVAVAIAVVWLAPPLMFLAVAEALLVLASRDRGRAGPTAPAGGLFLVSVTYGVVESRFTSKEP